jgi:hypothetical protein
MKKLVLSTLILAALSVGASAQSVAKTNPPKITTATHTTSKPNPKATTTTEKATATTKSTAAVKPRHKKHFVHKKKIATATK